MSRKEKNLFEKIKKKITKKYEKRKYDLDIKGVIITKRLK